MNKQALLQELQKDYQSYWKVELFDQEGFRRKKCKNCGKFFWTLTEQQTCNDASCRPYDFIGNPPAKKSFDYFETWEVVKKFFEKNGHASLKRFPVVCRWFPLYFTIAGIVNFYRLKDQKLDFEFPANPSVVNQICLRFNDIPNVGLNSKSYTCFGMINQQSLYDGKEGYWKDECIELDFKLLTQVFGIKPEEIVFIEDCWLGPSAFGPSLEYHVRGLELGNAVFTEFEGVPGNYKPMEKKVIDMGAGWERLCWITQGTPTSYDCVFDKVLEKMKRSCGFEHDEEFFVKYARLCGSLNVEEVPILKVAKQQIAAQLGISEEEFERKIQPMQCLYSIADHTRALVFALADGAIPSNVAGGYNLRAILRRALSLLDRMKWSLKLEDIVLWHIDCLKKMFPELEENKDRALKILEVEVKRWQQAKERSWRIVESFVKANKIPSKEELISLYDSQGITPEQLQEAGLPIEIPSDFYSKVTEKHLQQKPAKEKIFDVSNLPKTQILCYEPIFEFEAKVVETFDKFVVLDKSAFYPTSGGQLHDKGFIDGKEVLEVLKVGDVVLHRLEEPLPKGKIVKCRVDEKRREILKKHHTATHLVNLAARKVLGLHVWQHGAEKDVDKARLDITHYESLSEDQVEKIEKVANEFVTQDLPVNTEFLPRGEAEKKYGFRIYQGGPPSEKLLRIVSISNLDHQACSGTHCGSTKEVGCITILRTKRIADGVVRLEFAAGEVALSYLREKEKILREVANALKVKEEEVPKAVEELFRRWKKRRKKR